MPERWTVQIDAEEGNSMGAQTCEMPDNLHMTYRDALGWAMRLACGWGCFIEPYDFQKFPTNPDFDTFRLVPQYDSDIYVGDVWIKRRNQ